MRAPIVSRKHLVQFTEFSVASLTVNCMVGVRAKAIASVDTNFEVVEGSVIKAIFAELWILGKHASSQSSFVVVVEKVPAGGAEPTISQMTTLDAYSNKKNILFTSQGLIAPATANPTPVLRQWIKIPKGKQRFGLEDEFRICIASIGANDLHGCGLQIYKSYT